MNHPSAGLVPERIRIGALAERARLLINNARSEATRKGYARDFAEFQRFCAASALPHLPASGQALVLYLAWLSTRLRPATIARRLAAIASAHRAAGYPTDVIRSDAVRETSKGIRRLLGVAQKGRAPLLALDVLKIVRACPPTLLGLRDRALVLIGFAGAFRRAELTSLDITSIKWTCHGISVRLRRSKTDQEGATSTLNVRRGIRKETCPVRALRRWITAASIMSGPLFRGVDRHGNVLGGPLNPGSVPRILKRAAARARINADNIAAHSLRAGLVTEAALRGFSPLATMAVTRHRSFNSLKRYFRDVEGLRGGTAASAGL